MDCCHIADNVDRSPKRSLQASIPKRAGEKPSSTPIRQATRREGENEYREFSKIRNFVPPALEGVSLPLLEAAS